jgi:hypothetical protein
MAFVLHGSGTECNSTPACLVITALADSAKPIYNEVISIKTLINKNYDRIK